MFGIIRKTKREVRDRTVYMEVMGDNKIAYRVVVGKIAVYGEYMTTYGVEAEDYRTGDKECIADFSHDIEDAVDFAETLISSRIRPRFIYAKALDYLRISI